MCAAMTSTSDYMVRSVADMSWAPNLAAFGNFTSLGQVCTLPCDLDLQIVTGAYLSLAGSCCIACIINFVVRYHTGLNALTWLLAVFPQLRLKHSHECAGGSQL